jgi:DNA-binding transcriptional regulator YiaG
MENVKDKIRTLRTALGLTQEELARQIDVSLATVQRWEADKVVPSRLARKELVRLFKKAGIN